jgi:hypothetical protein
MIKIGVMKTKFPPLGTPTFGVKQKPFTQSAINYKKIFN